MRKYDTYKDSGIEWIGEIPSHWETARMKFHLDYQKGKNPKELKFSENENSEVYLAMDYLRGNPKQMLYVEDVENYVRVDDNEILLLWDGSNAGEFVLSKKGILSSTMAVLSLNNIQKDFSWYFFKHFEPQLKESTIGMGVPHVNGEELKNGFIALPTPEEQTAIAAYLDRKTAEIDELIADKKRLLELYEEEKTAIINQAVTKGLPAEAAAQAGINPDVPMKDSGIEWLGEIPEHWEVKRLKYVISQKLMYGANESAEEEIRENPRYIRITDFGNDGKLKDDTFKSLPFEKAKDYLLADGDILFARSGATVGKTFQFKNYEGLACFAGYLIKARPNPEILESDFLYYFTKSGAYENWKSSIFNQATIQNIGADKYAFLELPLPANIQEQQSIVHHIETECARIDAKKAKTEKLIELLTEYRTALISEVVTGKIRVT